MVEYIFQSMASNGILPDWGDMVNLRYSSLLLAGKKAKKGNTIIVESKKRVIPVTLENMMKTMMDISNAAVHSKSKNKQKVNLPEYLSCVDHSPFLLKSFALQLCDIVLWYKNYLRDHPNKEENALGWEKKD